MLGRIAKCYKKSDRNGGLNVGNDSILITDERVTKLLIQLVQKVSICFGHNIPNLVDYSTHTRTIK